MQINEKFIQVRGKVVTVSELEIGDDITVTVTIEKSELSDNNDGTFDLTYKAKLFAPGEFDGKEITIVKGGKSISKRIRSALFIYYTQVLKKDESGFDDYYEKVEGARLEKILEKLPE